MPELIEAEEESYRYHLRTVSRRVRWEESRRKSEKMRHILHAFLLSFLLALAFLFLLHFQSRDTMADMISADRGNRSRYYTSVKLNPGDSLWTIAEKYNTHSGMTDMEYIEEIRQINSLSGTDVVAGHYLTVCYYR